MGLGVLPSHAYTATAEIFMKIKYMRSGSFVCLSVCVYVCMSACLYLGVRVGGWVSG